MKPKPLQQGEHPCFYCRAHTRHCDMLMTEWLLEQARKNDLGGGSIFRAIAGFGRNGVLHKEPFFELADDPPVNVEFRLGEAQADALVRLGSVAGVDPVYARSPASFAMLDNTVSGSTHAHCLAVISSTTPRLH